MSKPSKYARSFLIAFAIFLLGWAVQVITNENVAEIRFPVNLYILLFLINILFFGWFFLRANSIVRFLASMPAAIAAICLFAVLSLLMGFIPQASHTVGFSNITSGWMYFFSNIFLLLVLGMVVVKRLIPFKLSNTGFILNHLGLWIVLAGGGLGAGDVVSLKMQTKEGETAWIAFNNKNEAYEMPIAIQLNHFSIMQYNPKLVLVNKNTGDIIADKKRPLFVVAEPGFKGNIKNFQIEVVEYIEDGVPFGEAYHKMTTTGAAPAAKVKVTDDKGRVFENWISAGSYSLPPLNLELSDNILIGMLPPEPQKYSSDVVIYTKDGKIQEEEISVNNPVSINGWKIYQSSYNTSMGKWSTESILELVKDPWLPFVYTGLFMMLAGSVFLFWKGRNTQKDD